MFGPYLVPEGPFRESIIRAVVYRTATESTFSFHKAYFGLMRCNLGLFLQCVITGLKVLFFLLGFKAPQVQSSARALRDNGIDDLFNTRVLAQSRALNGGSLPPPTCTHSIHRQPLAFLKLFLRFRHFACSDPRDRVYGLLGLADDGDAPELYVDYSESSHQVSIRLSKYFIEKGLGKSLLYMASCSTTRSPSWAIWIEEQGLERDILAHESMHAETFPSPASGLFRASGNTEFSCKLAKGDGNCLTTRGIIVATVQHQTGAFSVTPQQIHTRGIWPTSYLHMIFWGIRVAYWMRSTASRLCLPLAEWRAICFKTLLLDCSHNEHSKAQRNRTAEPELYRHILDF